MSDLILELASEQSKKKLIEVYKGLLQEYLNRRPSGTRMKIATALNKNKSFVSQITNPNYSIPIPATHLAKILEICRFSAKERETFLKAYTDAHPNYKYRIDKTESKKASSNRQITIDIPVLEDSVLQAKIEQMIKDYALQLFSLVKK